jgi:hypothetical protein
MGRKNDNKNILAMEKFNITFWKEPYNADNSFVKDIESFVTSATITKSTDGMSDMFHVRLTDIGLNSLYGEFDILRQNGLWKTSDQDSVELNFLKWNIIIELSNQMK